MFARDAEQLAAFVTRDVPSATLLPSLDPYIMGYRDRRRFLAEAHQPLLFDRAGNAVPTAWASGRVVGAWGQEEDARVQLHLLEDTTPAEHALLRDEAARLEAFLGEECLPAGFLTPSFRRLTGAKQ
jgi:hypothetical protein